MKQYSSNGNWLVKYKLYHIPFWIVYNFLWWTVATGNPLKALNTLLFTPFIIKFGFYVIFQAAAVYFNLYFLVPKYLEKGKYGIYITYLLVTLFCTSLCIVLGYYITAFVNHQTVTEIFGKDACFFFFFGQALPSVCASTTLAMSIKLTKKWIQSKRQQQALEKEKLETELKFLKSQLSPHFLFNIINSIFFLIRKNPVMASDALARFSGLLRHQLYECNDVQIPLSKELNYLHNYIELERLRQSQYISIQSEIAQHDFDNLSIAPFIIMPFIENAFKHVSRNADKQDWIKISLFIEDQLLVLNIANSYSETESTDLFVYGGIGLQNVKRRLELIYKGLYNLEITNRCSVFEVSLQIHLSTIDIPKVNNFQNN